LQDKPSICLEDLLKQQEEGLFLQPESKEDRSSLITANTSDKILFSPNYAFSLSLRIREFEDDKQFVKFIKNVESLVRKSYEFSLWRQYILEVLKVSKCAITFESKEDVSICIHHHIPSLFLLVKGVIQKYMKEEKEFCTFDIARDVIEIHYQNRLGYVPLTETMHEKFHNGKLDIPINLVQGDYLWCLSNLVFDTYDLEEINSRLAVQSWTKFPSWWSNHYPGMVLSDKNPEEKGE